MCQERESELARKAMFAETQRGAVWELKMVCLDNDRWMNM